MYSDYVTSYDAELPYKRINFIVSPLLKLHNKIRYLLIAVCVSYFEMLQNIVPSWHALPLE